MVAAACTITTRGTWAGIWAWACKVLPHILVEVMLITVSFFPILCGVIATGWLIHFANDYFVVISTLNRPRVTLCSPLILNATPLTVTVVSPSCCIG